MNFNAEQFEALRLKAKRMGSWMAARWCKNRGYTLDQAMVIVTGRLPRLGS